MEGVREGGEWGREGGRGEGRKLFSHLYVMHAYAHTCTHTHTQTHIQTVLDLADPKWANGTTRPEGMSSDPDVIRQVLYCFLVNASCDLFQSILIRELASLLRK